MSDVFISYSRKDIAFARLLQESLKQSQLDTWIDWDRIPVGERWWQEICEAIENANVFMFIISKTSVDSAVCKDEFNHAIKNNKRIIPVIVDNLQPDAIHAFAPELPQFNWIIFEKEKIFRIQENQEVVSDKPEDNQVALPKLPQFMEALEKLSQTIRADWEWVKYHTRLQVNALLWDNNHREEGYQLRGAALEEAERQLLRASGKEPLASELQIEFISLSRMGETHRHEEQIKLEKKARQRQKMIIWAIGIGLLAALGMGVLAWVQRNLYKDQRNIAVSSQLSSQALTETDNQFDLAVLLSMESMHYLDDPPAYNNNLLKILQSSPRLTAFLRGHTSDVTGVAISQDNKTLATSSGDSTIRLWDISTPDQPQPIGEPLTGHSSGVLAIAFSPDKSLLASGGGDDQIILWDLKDLMEVKALTVPLTGHTSDIRSLAFRPDGKLLASGGYDSAILLWDVSDPAQPQLMGETLAGHNDTVSSLAFSPDGKTLASTSWDGSLILWDIEDPQNSGMAWSSANFTFAKKMRGFVNDDRNSIYELWSVAFSPDGEWLATSDDNYGIQLWKVDELTFQNSVPFIDFPTDHISTINAVAFSPDGNTLATGSVDRTIRLWNISEPGAPISMGQPLTGHASDISSLVFSPDGKLLISGSWDDTAILWDVSNFTLPRLLGDQLRDYPSGVIQVAFSPDGRLIASANADKTFSLWDLSNPQQVIRIARPKARHSGSVNSVSFSPDGNLLATGSDDSSIILWDVSRPDQPMVIGQPLTGHSDSVWRVAFSPVGNILVSSAIGEEIFLWDISNPAVPTLIGQALEGISFAFSPDGKNLVTGGYKHPVYLSVWDIQDPQAPKFLVKQSMKDRFPIISLAFSPDGSFLASGNYDGKLILWDVGIEYVLEQIGQSFSVQKNMINSVAISPDSQMLVSSSEDRTVALWNISNLQLPVLIGQSLSDHAAAVTSAIFSPDGTELISSSKDTTIIRWHIDFSDLDAYACRLIGRNLSMDEWNQYLPEGEPYRKTCPQLP